MKLTTVRRRTKAPVSALIPETQQYDTILEQVLRDAQREHHRLQQIFEVMGWGELPDALKIEIKDDVQGMVDELEGRYSSCDPHVHARRKSVVYWVNAYRDGICSLETAIDVLKIRF